MNGEKNLCSSILIVPDMKRPRQHEDRHLDESDVFKVAQYIADASTMFAFLDVMHPLNMLGPLDHLYQLGLTWNRPELWPVLTVRRCSNSDTLHLAAILKFYARVNVADSSCDLDWLDHHVSPHADLSWTVLPEAPSSDIALDQAWWARWASHRITRVDIHCHQSNDDMIQALVAVLPRFTSLTSLSAFACNAQVAAKLIAVAATSRQLKALTFDGASTVRVTTSLCQHILAWFSALERVVEALPAMPSLQSFEMGCGEQTPKTWARFFRKLVSCRVTELTVRVPKLPRQSTLELAYTIAKNKTIQVVHAFVADAVFQDVKNLIEITTGNERPVQMTEIDIGESKLDASELAALTALAARRHVTFRFQRPRHSNRAASRS
ncbi:hypothetical protein DYB32_006694 [Aphanomyces invadans]|uniref:Uncharacterized protein n=1 Tax=Aphanomyces invadans TaxID=157072 RepID=A0A418AR69_9STRA|nr:hypothetical protein DYB32_006694 [Aphanomyces invadans]